MSIGNIRPTTLVGIKRLAVSLKRDTTTSHYAALDLAARRAGFESFRHAQNALPEPAHTVERATVFLTAYWRDKRSGESGRETLQHRLNTDWTDLVTVAQMKSHRALAGFRAEAPNHLVGTWLDASSDEARRHVCALARTLDFMDATRLRPSSSSSRIYPKGTDENRPPALDHPSSWYDPNTKRFVLVDEPYEPAALHAAAGRAEWGERFGWAQAKPRWPGMYNPDGGSRLYLFASREEGVHLEPLVSALDQLPAPPVASAWAGTSGPMSPRFVPPISPTAQVVKPAAEVPKPSLAKDSSLPYRVVLLPGIQRRPNGSMPVAKHQHVGMLLKDVLAHSHPRKGVYNRVNSIRSTLEDWLDREHPNTTLTNQEFLDVYYNQGSSVVSKIISVEQKAAQIDGLNEVVRTLRTHYPDSAPLRAMLSQLEAATASMRTWGF